jgi:charged multivesicular body protein 3
MGRRADRLATYKISGILKQSTGVMRDVNSLVKIPELNRDMRQFSMELTKVYQHGAGMRLIQAGIIGEMMDDTMEMLDEPDLEEEADAEVDTILAEITGGILGKAGKAPEVAMPSEEVVEEEPAQANLDEMRGRLETLRS